MSNASWFSLLLSSSSCLPFLPFFFPTQSPHTTHNTQPPLFMDTLAELSRQNTTKFSHTHNSILYVLRIYLPESDSDTLTSYPTSLHAYYKMSPQKLMPSLAARQQPPVWWMHRQVAHLPLLLFFASHPSPPHLRTLQCSVIVHVNRISTSICIIVTLSRFIICLLTTPDPHTYKHNHRNLILKKNMPPSQRS